MLNSDHVEAWASLLQSYHRLQLLRGFLFCYLSWFPYHLFGMLFHENMTARDTFFVSGSRLTCRSDDFQ